MTALDAQRVSLMYEIIQFRIPSTKESIQE
jgi:hypothetical protein